ncbi:MAG TPA: molybdenum cofactor guanylyltransferase [Candidatus Saccharimonadales bacterium]|nr:molybdenum cofactor guanylyltransferase [Candidatus Saccharimonadales bacterium]
MIGFVQAGGGSTRFGRDKALIELGGRTMLARTTELVAEVCGSAHIVAPRGKYPEAPAVVADQYPGEGPLGGIVTALSVTPAGDWALIVSCDMPFLTVEFLGELRRCAERSDKQVVVPRSVNGLEPLCAAWKREALPEVRAAFDAGIRKVTEAMKRLPMEVLDENFWKRFDSKGRLFWNMNTPGDFEEARRILEGPAST